MRASVDRTLAREALDRLLTHRVTNFRDAAGRLLPEGSLEALEVALDQGVAYVEIDTRVTADRKILVYHDALLETITTREGPVADYLTTSGPLHYKRPLEEGEPRGSEEPTEIPVPTLEQFLERFAELGSEARLQVDLKDPADREGNVDWIEREHCRLIREFGLTDRTWIISWYPEILWRVFEIDPRFRLGFSHLPCTGRWRPLTGPGRLLSRPLEWLIGRKDPNLAGVDLYFNDEEPCEERARQAGRFPMHILTRLPEGRLAQALRESGGGVGLKAQLLSRRYVRAARAAGLRTFVYTIEDTDRYLKAVREAAPDIIFSDAAATILADLAPAAGNG